MLTLMPYPEYRESGLSWVGRIPAHWGVRGVKYLLNETDGRSTTGAETLLRVSQYTGITRRGVSTEGQSRAESLIGYKKVAKGDLVINIMLAWNGSLGVSAYDGVVSPAYAVYKFRNDSDSRYFHHLFRTDAYKGRFKVASTGVVDSRLRLYSDDFFRVEAIEPPLEEQRSIDRFLTVHCAAIDKLIRAKRRVIELLNEQKQAIIHRAVTRGLDPNVRLKPSGVEWIGAIPSDWRVVKLGRLVSLQTGFPFPSGNFSDDPRDVRLLRGINIAPGRIRWESVVSWPSNKVVEVREFQLQVGDIVLGMDRPIIGSGVRVAVLGEADLPSLLLQRVARIRPTREIHRDFLMYILCGKTFADYLPPLFTGISVPHISPDQIASFVIALPGIQEQSAICDWIVTETSALSRRIAANHREIYFLGEYRTRLIADVVTGKLDVRSVELPELDSDEALEPLSEPEETDEDDVTVNEELEAVE